VNGPMKLRIVNPAKIPDWDAMLLRSGTHSFFHSISWARVLEGSYHYRPIYFVVFKEGHRRRLMPFMEVRSLLTGRRGVSLPFTDQCGPFIPDRDMLYESVQESLRCGEAAGWRYIEWWDAVHFKEPPSPSETYYVHDLNLEMSESELLSSFRDNNRRNIHKAVKDGLRITIDPSLDSIVSFYRLNCLTRK